MHGKIIRGLAVAALACLTSGAALAAGEGALETREAGFFARPAVRAAERVGELISVHVIPRPDGSVESILPGGAA